MSLTRPWQATCDGCGAITVLHCHKLSEAWTTLLSAPHDWHRAWYEGASNLCFCPTCWPDYMKLSGLTEITSNKEEISDAPH